MGFFDISQVPLKSLPTEVLVSLREGIRKELGRRGLAGEDVERSQGHAGLYGRTKAKPGEGESKSFRQRVHEFDALMAEDWSHLFRGGCEDRRFYVYAHCDPRRVGFSLNGAFRVELPGRPFYIGKGAGRRAWELGRNEGHGVELRQLRELGVADSEIVCIVRDNLTGERRLSLSPS